MNTDSVFCPHCNEALGGGRSCECGFDPALVFSVREAAAASAAKAAQLAANGNWQAAAEAAAESLRLQAFENDLAAFVLLVARLAGATGGPATVTEPRAEKLPLQLRPFVEPVVAAVIRLHRLGSEQNLNEVDLRRELHEVAESWPEIGWLAEEADEDDARPGMRLRPWALKRGLVTISAFIIGVAITSGVFSVVGRSRPEPPGQVQSAPDPSTELENLEAELRARDAAESDLALKIEVLKTLDRHDWSGLADALDRLHETGLTESLDKIVGPSSARAIFIAGMGASRRGRFAEAASLLAAASEVGPPNAYFQDDARYYEARALQRSGREHEALRRFSDFVSGFPESPYADDASRFERAIREQGTNGGASP